MPRRAKTDTSHNGAGEGARFDVSALRAALAKASGVATVSRATLANMIGSHPNSIGLWESGKKVGAAFLDKLRAIDARIGKGEKISLPDSKRKPGRPAKAKAKAKASAKRGRPGRPGRPKKRAAGSRGNFDVAALRAKLGASRVALAKLLGVSAGSIFNWERGKTITRKNLAKLRSLDSKGASVAVPARGRGGRLPKAAPVRRGHVSISGEANTVVYANQADVVQLDEGALLRFGLSIPGHPGARVVAEVVLTGDALHALR